MPWQAVPAAPVPTGSPDGQDTRGPVRGGNRRGPLLAGLTGRIDAVAGGLSRSLGSAVPHRTAAVAVGATLLLAIGVVVAAYTAGGDASGTSERATGTLQSAAPVPADLVDGTTAADPSAFGAVPEFRSPSGNIACRMADDGTRCDVANRSWTPPADPGCADAPGAGLVVGGTGGARPSCGGTPVGTGPELAYGTHLTRGDVTCVSRRTGVECRDAASGHGFETARASFRLN